MRKVKLHLKFFWPAIVLAVVGGLCWVFLDDAQDNFRMSLVGSGLGIGISIAVAEGFKKRDAHLRMKKTMGFLKLVTVPYLQNQADNLKETMKQYQDIDSLEKAYSLVKIASKFDSISHDFDKSWLNLVYSQDSIEAINDREFNKMAHTILELTLFTKKLTAASVNANKFLTFDLDALRADERGAMAFVIEARGLRDDLNDAAAMLDKYTDKFNDELELFFEQNGMGYKEFDR